MEQENIKKPKEVYFELSKIGHDKLKELYNKAKKIYEDYDYRNSLTICTSVCSRLKVQPIYVESDGKEGEEGECFYFGKMFHLTEKNLSEENLSEENLSERNRIKGSLAEGNDNYFVTKNIPVYMGFIDERDIGNGIYFSKEMYGKITYPNGSIYEGCFYEDKKNGYGKMIYVDKSIYEGNWVNNKMDGYGKITYPDGSKYEGHFSEDARHGPGKLVDNHGKIIHEGLFKNGKADNDPIIANSYAEEYYVKEEMPKKKILYLEIGSPGIEI